MTIMECKYYNNDHDCINYMSALYIKTYHK